MILTCLATVLGISIIQQSTDASFIPPFAMDPHFHGPPMHGPPMMLGPPPLHGPPMHNPFHMPEPHPHMMGPPGPMFPPTFMPKYLPPKYGHPMPPKVLRPLPPKYAKLLEPYMKPWQNHKLHKKPKRIFLIRRGNYAENPYGDIHHNNYNRFNPNFRNMGDQRRRNPGIPTFNRGSPNHAGSGGNAYGNPNNRNLGRGGNLNTPHLREVVDTGNRINSIQSRNIGGSVKRQSARKSGSRNKSRQVSKSVGRQSKSVKRQSKSVKRQSKSVRRQPTGRNSNRNQSKNVSGSVRKQPSGKRNKRKNAKGRKKGLSGKTIDFTGSTVISSKKSVGKKTLSKNLLRKGSTGTHSKQLSIRKDRMRGNTKRTDVSSVTSFTDPLGNTQIGPLDNSQTNRLGNTNTDPLGNAQKDPIGNAQRGPLDSAQIDPLGSAQTGMLGNTQTGPLGSPQIDSFGSAQTSMLGNTQTDPFGSTQTGPLGSPQTDPFGANTQIDPLGNAQIASLAAQSIDLTNLNPITSSQTEAGLNQASSLGGNFIDLSAMGIGPEITGQNQMSNQRPASLSGSISVGVEPLGLAAVNTVDTANAVAATTLAGSNGNAMTSPADLINANDVVVIDNAMQTAADVAAQAVPGASMAGVVDLTAGSTNPTFGPDMNMNNIGNVEVLTLDKRAYALLENAMQAGKTVDTAFLDSIISGAGSTGSAGAHSGGATSSSLLGGTADTAAPQVYILDGAQAQHLTGSANFAGNGVGSHAADPLPPSSNALHSSHTSSSASSHSHSGGNIPHAANVLPGHGHAAPRAHSNIVGVVGEAVGHVTVDANTDIMGLFSMPKGANIPNVPASVVEIPKSIGQRMSGGHAHSRHGAHK